MLKIDGSVAIVTGGNRGIGEGFVLELLAQGAKRVHVGTRDPKNAEHLKAQAPDRVNIIPLDVTNAAQIAAAVKACGDVNILVNNAGLFTSVSLLDAPDMSDMRNEMEVNCFGTIAMMRAFAPVIEANGGGAIANVLSVGGIVAVPEMGGYSPSKFAARAASDCFRAELAPKGIHVASLIVGSVKTRMAEHVKGLDQADPRDIAKAGIHAMTHNINDHDTDPHAIRVRAALARDPAALAKYMAGGVGAAR